MKSWLFLFFSIGVLIGTAQPVDTAGFAVGYFSAPMNIPLYLAGNFGEIRSNHFHAGLDMKTQGKEGIPILAAADGYVSRIKISTFGYGKVVYIDHPNGYTTTYAHLQQLTGKCKDYLRTAQYEQEQFSIEIFPKQNELPVKRGEQIALSGNTGGSGGPHLHFEIRDTKTEHALNPLLFGFNIKDNVNPVVQTLGIYPADGGKIQGKSGPYFINLNISGKNRKVAAPITVEGGAFCALSGIDRLSGVSNRCGIYSMELYRDNQLVYKHKLRDIAFDESRFINAHVDHYQWHKFGRKLQRSFSTPYNDLQVYDTISKTPMTIASGDTAIMKYIVKDAYDNKTEVSFKLVGKEKAYSESNDSVLHPMWEVNKPNHYIDSQVQVFLLPYTLYEAEKAIVKPKGIETGWYSKGYKILGHFVPAHQKYQLSIKVDNMPANPKQLYIAKVDRGGSRYIGGQLVNGWMVAQTKRFGTFAVKMDTKRPLATPITFKNGSTITANSRLRLKIADGGSGIKSYRVEINGHWALFEYDYKRAALKGKLRAEYLVKGKNQLTVEVADKCGNVNRKEYSLYY